MLLSTIFLASFLYICCFNPLHNCKVGWKDHENVIITKLLSQSHTPLTLHYHSAWNNLMTFSLHIIPLYKMDKTFANSQEVFCRGRCIWWCPGWTQYATPARSWSGWQTTPQKRWLVPLVNLDSHIGNSLEWILYMKQMCYSHEQTKKISCCFIDKKFFGTWWLTWQSNSCSSLAQTILCCAGVVGNILNTLGQ